MIACTQKRKVKKKMIRARKVPKPRPETGRDRIICQRLSKPREGVLGSRAQALCAEWKGCNWRTRSSAAVAEFEHRKAFLWGEKGGI